MKTVIMAGGKGTRVAELCPLIPKPMIPICGKTVLERELEVLRAQGLTDIILVIGHLGGVIKEALGDGTRLGVHLTYVEERTPLGTAGALALLKDELADDDFLLLCGDLVFDVDLCRFLAAHREKGGIATLLTHPSDHPFDSVIVKGDRAGRVTAFLPPEASRGDVKNRTNAGIHAFSPTVLDLFGEVKRTDLDREILAPLAATGALYYYDTPEYVKDMGTPDRIDTVTRDILSGRVKKSNLSSPQRAIFLDRDGTVNRYVGFLTAPDQMVLEEGAAEAIRAINRAGLLAVLVTNQPVVARGDVTEAELDAIHDRMETLLGREGAYLNAICYCPHHPDSGFAGEIGELKIKCRCRKPEPGMLLDAAERFHINLSASYMIGDDARDIEAGKRAGCRTASIGEGLGADLWGDSLLACVNQILKEEGLSL
ncbi:MAG: HAD-IIIA family hydrolase [Ruminococcaceae bacterium]|nr:HAD-IIIA family hydrolase [Oscillospiraceae bacterium]